MMKTLESVMTQLKTALSLLILMTIITGVIYPALITVIAQQFFPWRANGSLIELDGKWIGSQLIGQQFDAPDMFWGRPSATKPYAYNAANSSGSNLGPSNPVLVHAVKERIAKLEVYADKHDLIPIDLVTSSASGIDPEISPLAAFFQAERVAKARHLPLEVVNDLISTSIKHRTFMILGEPRVNVLELNLALEKLRSAHGRASSRS